jgi:hypothetical protein
MDHLISISLIINCLVIFHLFRRIERLEKPKTISFDKNQKLKTFYNNHYKTAEMRKWSELSNEDLWNLSKTSEYLSYDLDFAKKYFTNTFKKTYVGRKIQNNVEWIERLLA